MQLELQKEFDWFNVNVTANFIYDAIAPSHNVHLEKGIGGNFFVEEKKEQFFRTI